MHEIVKNWLEKLYGNEIEDIKIAISNEHLWELGYDGEESCNPHTENIEVFQEYLEYLEEQLVELN